MNFSGNGVLELGRWGEGEEGTGMGEGEGTERVRAGEGMKRAGNWEEGGGVGGKTS